jgi:hypothetical protein
MVKSESSVTRVDLPGQDYFRNPAAAIAKLRAAGVVVKVRFPDHRHGVDDDHAGAGRSGAEG